MSDLMETDTFISPPRDTSSVPLRAITPKSCESKFANSQAKRRMLYKTPPNWFKNYREKCIDALNTRRQERQNKLADRFRKINIEDGEPEDERGKLAREAMFAVYMEHNIEHDYDKFWMDYKDILQDLEHELSNEYSYYDIQWDYEQQAIDWALEYQYSLTCFACQKCLLSVVTSDTRTQVICKQCQFNILVDFPFTDVQFYNRFTQIIDEHDTQCRNTMPYFEWSHQMYPINNVRIACKSCNFEKMLF